MSLEKILSKLARNFVALGEKGFVYGPQGELFRRNLESLWIKNSVTLPSFNVFLIPPDKMPSHVCDLTKMSVDESPVGVAFMENSKNFWNQELVSKSICHRVARAATIGDESVMQNLFYKLQRERKVWWRKLAKDPGIFVLNEAKRTKGSEVMELKANFGFGDIVVENLVFYHDLKKFFPQKEEQPLEVSSMRMIEHVTSLDWGSLTLLCDGYSNKIDEMPVPAVHPKLSPYKVAIQTQESNRENEDTNQLLIHINNTLRKNYLDTVIVNNSEDVSLFSAPYEIAVDKTSLQTGIVKVVSRATTIGEDVHITQLVKHLTKHCNY